MPTWEQMKQDTISNNLKASELELLNSILNLCKTMWESECTNRDCDECHLGRKKADLKEKFLI